MRVRVENTVKGITRVERERVKQENTSGKMMCGKYNGWKMSYTKHIVDWFGM